MRAAHGFSSAVMAHALARMGGLSRFRETASENGHCDSPTPAAMPVAGALAASARATIARTCAGALAHARTFRSCRTLEGMQNANGFVRRSLEERGRAWEKWTFTRAAHRAPCVRGIRSRASG